jgi:hypothetical protein
MSHRILILPVVMLMVTIAFGAEDLMPPPTLAGSSEVAVRLSFTEPTPVTEIYRAVGETAGVEIVFDPRFNERQVTIDIDTPTTSAALDLVSAAAGDLWVATAGKAVIVADDTPQNHRLENGSVREAEILLRSIVEVRRMQVDESLRTVTVRDAVSRMPIIEHLIGLVDHPPGEIDTRVELLRLPNHSGDRSPPSRFTAAEYADWRRGSGAIALADSTLSLVGGSRANLHLGAVKASDLSLNLRLEGRVHPQSRDVTLEVRAMLARTDSKNPDDGIDRPALGRIETAARLTGGSTLLLRVSGTTPGDVAIAITPTIVRSTDFDAEELASVWVGTESRIHASR